ncbi:MAG: hypothetical protein IJ589_09945, partial [Lachnospiraceae bacterium]|nr:hypothetical protein [Lachnospiraceae bacterium]
KRWIALTCSLFYALSLYRIVNAFRRGAVGEYSAMAFLPLAVCGLLIILENDERIKKGMLMLSLGTACTLCTHNITALLLLANLAMIFLLKIIVDHKTVLKKTAILAIAKAAGLATAISAYFWLPMLTYLRTGDMGISGGLLSGNTVENRFAEKSLDVSGLLAFGSGFTQEEILGILILCIGLLYPAVLLYRRIRYRERSAQGKTGLILFLLWAMQLWFSSKLADWALWSTKSILINKWISVMQFPFRYLTMVTALGVLLLGYLLMEVSETALFAEKKFLARVGICALLLISGLNAFLFQKKIDEVQTGYRLYSKAAFSVYLAWGLDASFELPDSFYLPSGTNMAYYKGTFSNLAELNPTVNFTGEPARKGLAATIGCQNPSSESTILLVPYVMYPGYEAVDTESNIHLPVQKGPAAMVQVNLPGGYDGTLQVRFREPLSWKFAEVISLLAVLTLIAYLVKGRAYFGGTETAAAKK